jgi:hypothetical protein
MRRLLLSCTVVCSLLTGAASLRATLLTGAVSFDSQTDLYTYDYTVDVPVGDRPIYELVVKVDSVNLFWENGYLALPVIHTEPSGWSFSPGISFGDVGGAITIGPIQTFGPGSDWGWRGYLGGGIAPGSTGHFSFSTTQGPTPTQNVNSFLYIGDVFQDNTLNFVEVGHVVAPDFMGGTGLIGGQPVPDGGAWVMCEAAVFCGVIAYHAAQKRKGPSRG